MQYRFSVLCALLVISTFLCLSSDAISVQKAEYQDKSTTFLGVPVSLREYRVEFDEDVYHLQGDFACPNVECAHTPNGTEMATAPYACDPTAAGWCADTSPLCAPYRAVLCDGSSPLYTVIQLGQKYLEHVNTKEEKYYVYKTSGPCQYLSYRADPLWGDPQISVYHLDDFPMYLSSSPTAYEDQRPLREGNFFGPDRFSVCPGQQDYPFRIGAHVIIASSFDSARTATGPVGSSFYLSVLAKNLPAPSTAPTCTVPAEASTWTEPDGSAIPPGTWNCLTDGVGANFSVGSGATRYYVYSIPLATCQNLYWYQWSYGIFIGYAFGNDVKVPYESTDFVATDWNVVSFGGNPKGDFLYACSNATHQYHLLMKVEPNPIDYARTPAADFNLVYIDSTPSYRFVEKIADKEHYVATWDLQMSSQLRCKRGDNSLTKRQCNFRLDLFGDASECSRFWHYYPSEVPIPIFPLNTWLFGDSRFVNYYPRFTSPQSDGKSYFAASLIRYQPDISQAPVSAYENTAGVLDTCEMTFMGSIVDAAGAPITSAPVSFTPAATVCESTTFFQEIVPNMANLTDQMRATTVPTEVRDLRVSMDILTYAPSFSDCVTYATDLMTTSPVTRTIVSTVCDPDNVDPTDPCCNSSLAFYGQECVARPVSYSINKFDRLTKPAQSACSVGGSSQCSGLFGSDFVSAVANAGSSLEGCGVNTPVTALFQGESKRAFRNASDTWFGVDPDVGHRCSMDAECTLLPASSCDLLKGSCNYNISEQFRGFLNDWVPTLSIFMKNKTAQQLGFSDYDNINSWYTALTQTSDCTGAYDWAFGLRRSYARKYTVPSNAAACDIASTTGGENYCPNRYCFSSACTVDFQCQMAIGANSLCWSAISTYLPATCEQTQLSQALCNWVEDWNQPSLTSVGTAGPQPADCTANSSVCAVCEAGTDRACLGFPSIDMTTCGNSYACFLNNGSRIITSSVSECNNIMSCNSTCYDSNHDIVPCTQGQCQSGTAGICSSHAWSYSATGSYRPACVLPPTTFWGETTDCPAISSLTPTEYGRSTPFGCIYYQNATSTCSLYGASAKPFYTATNETACLAPSGCWQVFDNSNFRNDHTFTFADAATCASVGGEIRSFNQWHPATWAGGMARPLTWLTATANVVPFPSKPTPDLVSLSTAFQYAINSAYSIPQLSETFCRYNALVRSLQPVLCSCAADGTKTSACYPAASSSANDKSTASASFLVCQGTGTFSQRAAPAQITFDQTSVTGCNPTTVNIFPASTYAQSGSEALSTFLLDFQVSKPYQFTNSHGVLVAQILGDGVIITGDYALQNVKLCINPRLDITVNNSKYSVYDFASVDFSQSNPRPEILYMDAVNDTSIDAVCATFPSLSSSRAYFAIRRLTNSANKKKYDFPTGEKVFYAFMCTIYLFASFLAGQRFIASILAGSFAPRNTQVWIFLTVCTMMFIRGLYVILILTGVVVGNNSTAIDYILVELPSFMYLTVMTFFIIIWATLIRVNRKLSRRKNNANFWGIFFAINGVIYVIFIVLIIIYESVKPKQKVLCGGRLTVLDQKVRQRTAIAYRVILAAFALAISLAFFITGSQIYLSLRGASNVRAARKRKMFWLTAVCSAGLLALSALLIALAATGTQNNFLALGLLVLFEAVPCTVIVVSLWNVETKEQMSDTKGATQMRSMVTDEKNSASATGSRTKTGASTVSSSNGGRSTTTDDNDDEKDEEKHEEPDSSSSSSSDSSLLHGDKEEDEE